MKPYNKAKTHEEKMAALNLSIVLAQVGTVLGLVGIVLWPLIPVAAGFIALSLWWGRGA
jgi:cell division septal protein FtsQ